MARFVLVHGAFGGRWVWDPVIPLLERAGHSATAIDLPGGGDDPTPIAYVTLNAYAERIVAALAEQPEPPILVGHSMGGIAVTQAAARAPGRIAALIYVAAFLPQDGQSLIALTELPEGAGDQVQANIVVAGDPPSATLPPDRAVGAILGETEPELARAVAERLGRQAAAPMATPVALDASPQLAALPRYYVLCARDRAIPPALQRRMLETQGVAGVAELEADHMPFYSAPDELAAALDRFATAAVPSH